MRIVQIASGDFFSTYGGGQVYVKNLVDEMIRNRNMEVAVISLVKDNENSISEKCYNGIRLIEINSGINLEEAIQLIAPDIIHAHSLKDQACMIGVRLGIPVVVTAHHGGILCPAGTRLNCNDEICHSKVTHSNCLPCVLRNIRSGRRWWYPFMRHISEKNYLKLGNILTKLPFIPFISPIGCAAISIKDKQRQWSAITNGCSAMVAPCRDIADAMLQNGLDRSKVRIIPHGIPLPPVRPEYPDIINGSIDFYYVGRICYFKGIHTLLEAFSKVDNPKIRLHLIGGAGNKHELRYMEKLKKRHSYDSRIIWHGKISPETIFETTRSYHVSTTSSYLEAFGLNIAEALALGKPVLATRNGGAEMQIINGKNGWLVDTNDVQSLSDKICEIAAHPELLEGMSQHCKAKGITEHAAELFNLYVTLHNNEANFD